MSKTLGDVECRVLPALLDRAADTFSNHGCTDFNLERLVPNLADRRAIMREYEEHNSRGRDYDPEATYENVNDWILMLHFANKLGRP